MPTNQQAIIIGGSHAAAQLSLSLRQEGWQGKIVVISDSDVLPYQRPPLSKNYLGGETSVEKLIIRPAALYDKNEINFILNTRVDKIDRSAKIVSLSNGESLHYNKLALCTGARVRELPIPGAQLKGVHYLRDLQDAQAIKQDIKPGDQAVIIGGGYIGLETAASLRKLGLKVCVLETMERVLERVTSAEISAFYHQVHTQEGVEIKTSVMATEIIGTDRAQGVMCNTGEKVNADLVIIGIGVIPNVELAEEIGLDIDNGIVVNEFAQSSDADIVAAGDCTMHPNLIYGRSIRLESVPNASEQAKAAAASICGNHKSYNALPWFWSNQYDLRLQIAGLNHGFDQVVIRGDINSSRSFVAWYLKDNAVIAADCINRPAEFMFAKKMIAANVAIPLQDLVDDSIEVKTLMAALK